MRGVGDSESSSIDVAFTTKSADALRRPSSATKIKTPSSSASENGVGTNVGSDGYLERWSPRRAWRNSLQLRDDSL